MDVRAISGSSTEKKKRKKVKKKHIHLEMGNTLLDYFLIIFLAL